jgi:hypothetical protein
MARGLASTKARALGDIATAHGWDAHIADGDVWRGFENREEQPVGMLIARRGDEVVTATWVAEVATGPIGWYSSGETTARLKNRAEAERRLKAPPADEYLRAAYEVQQRIRMDG